MQKNQVFISTASGYGTEGEAVFRQDGTSVFVPFCLDGEEAEVKVLAVKGGAAYGKCMRVIKPSPHRVTPECGVFGKCGGCRLQHMDYPSQLAFKTLLVKNALKKIGGIDAEVLPARPSGAQYAYRNKLVLPVGRDEDGNTVIGFYAARSHRIVPVSDCPIQAGWCADVISAMKRYLGDASLTGYDELTRRGDIRRIAVREADGKFIAVLVAAHKVDARPLAEILKSRLGDVTLLLNINNSEGNAVFGEKFTAVCGDGFFVSDDMGIKFRAGANTFLQVNDGVRTELYQKIVEEAGGDCVAADLYSGGGMLTALLARACTAAYGIEVVPEASACADELKELNGLSDRMFNICGTVEEKLPALFSQLAGRKKVIVCDPPRKGMERSVCEAVRASDADKVILVSCNPATLARDLGIILGTLKEEGGVLKKTPEYGANTPYILKYVQPYDMFPQTKWCETVAVLKRK